MLQGIEGKQDDLQKAPYGAVVKNQKPQMVQMNRKSSEVKYNKALQARDAI